MLSREAPSRLEHLATLLIEPSKTRATFSLNADLLDQVRNAVVALSGPPDRLTMAKFAENAFRHELQRLERKQGSSFPPRKKEVRTGRPIV